MAFRTCIQFHRKYSNPQPYGFYPIFGQFKPAPQSPESESASRHSCSLPVGLHRCRLMGVKALALREGSLINPSIRVCGALRNHHMTSARHQTVDLHAEFWVEDSVLLSGAVATPTRRRLLMKSDNFFGAGRMFRWSVRKRYGCLQFRAACKAVVRRDRAFRSS